MAYIGKEPGSGLRGRFVYTATAGQTSFTGSDSLGRTLTYTDSEYTDVFLNGVKLDKTDYTATSGTSIVLDSGASADDTLEILAFDTFGLFSGEFAQDVSVGGDLTASDDIKMTSDSAQIAFGADSEVTLTHVADTGLTLKHTATADDKPINLTLATGETDMAANDVLGKINFQAPDEGTGTDAILVSGAVQARAEGDFSSSSNATSLDFMTGASEAATTKMTLTSAGALGIGTTSPSSILHLSASDDPIITLTDTGASASADITGSNGNLRLNSSTATIFDMADSEIARFDSSGNFFLGISSGSPSTSVFGYKLAATGALQNARNTGGTGAVFKSFGNAGEFRILGDGDAQNTNNSYTAISDEKLKENISDALSQWDDIKAVRVRKYSLKERNLDAADSLGVIAQELEVSGMNGLVKEVEADEDSEETVKTVKYSILYMKAVKALQEAMERIETLETKVAALEG